MRKATIAVMVMIAAAIEKMRSVFDPKPNMIPVSYQRRAP